MIRVSGHLANHVQKIRHSPQPGKHRPANDPQAEDLDLTRVKRPGGVSICKRLALLRPPGRANFANNDLALLFQKTPMKWGLLRSVSSADAS